MRSLLVAVTLLAIAAALLMSIAPLWAQGNSTAPTPGPRAGGAAAPPKDAPASAKPLSAAESSRTVVIIVIVVAVLAGLAAFILKKRGAV